MYTLACRDLGTPECLYVARGSSEDETVQAMIGHATQAHTEKIAGKTNEALGEMMRPAVQSE